MASEVCVVVQLSRQRSMISLSLYINVLSPCFGKKGIVFGELGLYGTGQSNTVTGVFYAIVLRLALRDRYQPFGKADQRIDAVSARIVKIITCCNTTPFNPSPVPQITGAKDPIFLRPCFEMLYGSLFFRLTRITSSVRLPAIT